MENNDDSNSESFDRIDRMEKALKNVDCERGVNSTLMPSLSNKECSGNPVHPVNPV